MAFRRFLVSGLLSVAVLCLLSASGASAATLNVVGGQLLGASNVDVGGALYNVEFVDGTCVGVFDGCDSVADFTFITEADARLASQALLDQVFIDGVSGNFDSVPELTSGCSRSGLCQVFTAFAIDVTSVLVINAANQPFPGPQPDIVATNAVTLDSTFNLSSCVNCVYAVWTPVPNAGQTDPGTGVVVEPEAVDENGDPVVGAPAITFDFDEVTGSGETTVIVTETGPPPADGLKLGNPPIYFDLDTTATFAGDIEVCIDYSGISYGGDAIDLKLFHREAGVWVNKTTTNDTVGMVICASVTSFSFFAIFEPAPPSVPSLSLYGIAMLFSLLALAGYWRVRAYRHA